MTASFPSARIMLTAVSTIALLLACAGPNDKEIAALVAAADAREGVGEPEQEWHRGPGVAVDDEVGPARFVGPLFERFDLERCLGVVRFVDGFYRAPANDGYNEVLDRLRDRLTEAGFGGEDKRFELRVIETPRTAPSWTPISAELSLMAQDGTTQMLHAFSKPGDVDRVMLPENAPSCDVDGYVALELDSLEPGMILVTEVPSGRMYKRAKARGAAAIVSASLSSFNVDPTGEDRHLKAIKFVRLGADSEMPAAQISPETYQIIADLVAREPKAKLRFKADVKFENRPLRSLVAAIVGDERPDEAVAVVSHIQEPGACDNATGVGGLFEGVLGIKAALDAGQLEWPSRTVVSVWGDEFRQSTAWLEDTKRTPVAGFSSDMTGQSKAKTGAIALLERGPDPGAIVTLEPDQHTPWGAGEVSKEAFDPNGLSIVARCAMIDVARFDEAGWETADHPWEGGSDHDVFIDRNIPAVLFWHFTDFAYHTGLDRMDMVDAAELRRTTVAILSTVMAVADPLPTDLDRYLQSNLIEQKLRTQAALAAEGLDSIERDTLAQDWEDWCRGARHWLRELCLGLESESGNSK